MVAKEVLDFHMHLTHDDALNYKTGRIGRDLRVAFEMFTSARHFMALSGSQQQICCLDVTSSV